MVSIAINVFPHNAMKNTVKRRYNKIRDRLLLKCRCGECEFKSICSGCRARAYAETQDYLDEDPSCIYEPGKYDFKEIILTEKDTLGIEITYRLPWEKKAQNRLLKIPSFARGMVVKGVELFVENHDYPEVTVEIMKEARKSVIGRTMVPFLKKEM